MGAVVRDVERSATDHPRLVSQIERHPWLSIAGGVMAGIVAGKLVGPLARGLRSALFKPESDDGNENGDRPGTTGLNLSSMLATILVPPLQGAAATLIKTVFDRQTEPAADEPDADPSTGPAENDR
jgi:hypothetical protein